MQQPGSPETKKIREVTCRYTEACLASLQQTEEPAQTEASLRAAGGWSVLLIAFPTPQGQEDVGLTDCEKACLALLAQLTEPIPGLRACAELERRDLGIYGEATVKRALVRLKNRGLISNARTYRRGYFLPEAGLVLRKIVSR